MQEALAFEYSGFQFIFLQPVTFPAQSFDPVPVNSPGEVFRRNGKAGFDFPKPWFRPVN